MKLSVATAREKNKISVGGVTFAFYGASFEGIRLPSSFVFLLLNEKTRKRALKLFHQMKRTVRTDEGYSYLLSKAGNDGLAAAWQELKQLENAKPNGKPKFYRSIKVDLHKSRHDPEKQRVVLSNGNKAFSFPCDLKVSQWPPNVYCREERVNLLLDEHMFTEAERHTNEFFELLLRIDKVTKQCGAFFIPNKKEILEDFFYNKARSHESITNAEIYCRFFNEPLKCSQGYLIYKEHKHGWLHCYLVTPTGEIFRFKRLGLSGMRETILSAVKAGAPIQNLKKVKPLPREMRAIAEHVGKLDPALALTLLP